MLFGIGTLCMIIALGLVNGQPLDIFQGKRPPIVGGDEINIEQTPYQISMRRNGRHICGGSILSDHIVISAGHCIYGLANSKTLSVVAGATLLSSNDGQEFRVARFVMHPKYRDINKDYDVVLLILNGQFKFNHFVKIISLATIMPSQGSKTLISGWGYLDHNIPITPNHLMATEVELFPDSKCRAAYWYMTTDRMICAGVDGGGIDACSGDSGGPMVYEGELVGVVSAGNGCGDPDFFGIYAKVPRLHEWIVDAIKNNTIHLL